MKAFDQRKECFVEQYSKYEVFGYQVRAFDTLLMVYSFIAASICVCVYVSMIQWCI